MIPYYKITYDMPGLEKDVIRYFLDSDSATGTYPAYRLDAVTVPLGRVSVNAVVRFADGHEAEEIEYAVDGDAAEIVTENGRTFLQAKENGSVTVTAFYDGGESGKFNVTVSEANNNTSACAFHTTPLHFIIILSFFVLHSRSGYDKI